METTYLRTPKQSFLVVKEADYPFEQYELKMIQNNTIPSLLEFQVIITDGRVEYWYDVTGMQSLEKQFAMDGVGTTQIRQLLRGIMDLKSAMENYLLDDENVVFSNTMVYYDRFLDHIRFCYIPGLHGREAYGLQGLFEELLQKLNHQDATAVKMGYEMYERCIRSEFVVADCLACLRMSEPEVVAGASHGDTSQGGMHLADVNIPWEEQTSDAENTGRGLEFLPMDRVRKNGHRRRRKKRNRINYEKLLEEEQQILIAAEQGEENGYTEHFSEKELIKMWSFSYKGDGLEQDFSLWEFPFLVGTDAKRVDGVLQARTVSRIHARFWLEEDKLYMEDNNSTNGTYLNQKLIPMNTPTEVQDGDVIVFATEEYAVSSRRTPRRK